MHQQQLFSSLVLLLLCLCIYQAGATITPLVCTLESDAVAVVAAACQVVVDCRFEFGTGANALSLSAWDVLLTTQAQLLSPSATEVLPQDARKYFIPVWYIVLPLMAYDPLSVDAVDCAPIAAAPQTDLPDAVFALLDTLSKYQRYVSDTSKCSDINQIGIWTNASGTPGISCQCAPGKVCTLGNTTLDSLIGVVAIMVAILIAAATLVSFYTSINGMLAYSRALKHYNTTGKQQHAETIDAVEMQAMTRRDENNAGSGMPLLASEYLFKTEDMMNPIVHL